MIYYFSLIRIAPSSLAGWWAGSWVSPFLWSYIFKEASLGFFMWWWNYSRRASPMTRAYQASARVTFADVPSAKADHTPKPRIHVERVSAGWGHRQWQWVGIICITVCHRCKHLTRISSVKGCLLQGLWFHKIKGKAVQPSFLPLAVMVSLPSWSAVVSSHLFICSANATWAPPLLGQW